MSQAKLTTAPSPWPHRLAVLLCCATFPLVWVGGLVTTYQAGMAVPDWPNTYGYNLFLYPIGTWLSGPWNLFIEHGHRLFASGVGLLTIALCLSLWRTSQPRWLRLLGLAALFGVLLQGILGGMRVLMDARTLAMVHGCTGPAFFALTAALAVLTSRSWRKSPPASVLRSTSSPFVLAMITPMLAYAQILLGAQLRHVSPDQPYELFRVFVIFHVVVAIVLAVNAAILSAAMWRIAPRVKPLRRAAVALAGLVAAQLVLGAASWVVKYGWPAFVADSAAAAAFTVQAKGWWQAQITTAHVAMGSLILAVATVLALSAWRVVRTVACEARTCAAITGVTA